MRDETCGAPLRLFRAGLATVVAGFLSSCGSDPSTSPAPTPDTTPAFVHMLDARQQVLSTFKADPRTGDLSLVDTKAVPNAYGSGALAADPRGRFVYVNEAPAPSSRWIRSYRVDGPSGALTLAGEASVAGLGLGSFLSVRSLAASPRHLYVGGSTPSGHHSYYSLSVLTVDESGVLADGRRLMSDWDGSGGFERLVGVDGERDVVLAEFRWSYQLRALTLDATVAAGCREIARVDFHDSGPGPEGPISSVVAADGRVFFTEYQGRLFTYVLNEAAGTFDERGRVPDAGRPSCFGAPDRLAVVTPQKSVLYDAARKYYHWTTSVALYRVEPDGGLSLLSELPESYFAGSPTLAFHPSRRLLYACGYPSDGSPWGSVLSKAQYLLTFSIGEDSALTLFGALPVDGCGPMVVTAPGS